MTGTEFQTTHRPQDRWSDHGVVAFATQAPVGAPVYGQGVEGRKDEHGWRTAAIGATGLALLVALMGGIGFYRGQPADTGPTAATGISVPMSTYVSQVPQAAAFERVTIPASTYASQVPQAAALERVMIPASTYASQVPQAAR